LAVSATWFCDLGRVHALCKHGGIYAWFSADGRRDVTGLADSAWRNGNRHIRVTHVYKLSPIPSALYHNVHKRAGMVKEINMRLIETRLRLQFTSHKVVPFRWADMAVWWDPPLLQLDRALADKRSDYYYARLLLT
jgi:hypothetical protein